MPAKATSLAAAMVGLSRRHAYKWIQRFMQEGLEGLHDKPRHDRRIESHRADRADQGDVDIVFESL